MRLKGESNRAYQHARDDFGRSRSNEGFLVNTDGSNVCILASTATGSANTGATSGAKSVFGMLPFTGANALIALFIAVALLVVGLLIILIVRSRRRVAADADDRTSVASSRLFSIVLLAILVSTLSLTAGGATKAFAADGDQSGCELLSFSIDSSSTGLDRIVSGTPTEMLSTTVKNITNGFINVSFASQLSTDPDGLASFIEVTGLCSCSSVPVMQSMLGAGVFGPAVRLAAGQSITVHVSANVTSTITNALQGSKSSFVLIANAIEAP